jgi:acetyl esterase/lipase
LIPYVPEHPSTHTAVLVIPGGGYSHLSLQPEGTEIAAFLSAHGIPAFVLQYRIAPVYQYPVELLDGQRAIRYLRAHAKDYGLTRIGVAGFSAGGHLASMLGTNYDPGSGPATDPVERVSDRPDFLVLGYPVISTVGWAASGSFHNLAGDADLAGLEMLSTDLHVTPDTPPTFLVCADNDKSVSPENAVRFYLALHRVGVSAELHIYQHGGHGFGLAAKDPVDATWTGHLLDWMRANGYLDAAQQSTDASNRTWSESSRQ